MTDSILAGLSAVHHPLASSMTLPPACYHDEDWLERERDRLFRRGWICVGREDRAKAPGDYFTFKLGNVSLVITRDEQGRLGAFANTCRHRGMPIASGAG